MRVLALTKSTAARLLSWRRDSSRAAEPVAARIIADVRRRGDAELFAWTRKFDGLALDSKTVWVSAAEMRAAAKEVPGEFLDAIDHAAKNIREVAKRQKPHEWSFEVEPGVRAAQIVRPIDSVGCYLPGGRFSLVSTLLMTTVLAQEAGVRRIVVTSPQPGPALLAAAARLGIESVARVGGAQAIAALAYGTKSIERVERFSDPAIATSPPPRGSSALIAPSICSQGPRKPSFSPRTATPRSWLPI